jgi:hypothetical protein
MARPNNSNNLSSWLCSPCQNKGPLEGYLVCSNDGHPTLYRSSIL